MKTSIVFLLAFVPGIAFCQDTLTLCGDTHVAGIQKLSYLDTVFTTTLFHPMETRTVVCCGFVSMEISLSVKPHMCYE